VLSRSEGIAWRIWHARGTGRDDHASFGSKRLARLTSSAQLDTAWYPFEAFVFSQVYLTVDDSSAVICIDVEGFFSPLKAFVEGAVQAGSAFDYPSALPLTTSAGSSLKTTATSSPFSTRHTPARRWQRRPSRWQLMARSSCPVWVLSGNKRGDCRQGARPIRPSCKTLDDAVVGGLRGLEGRARRALPARRGFALATLQDLELFCEELSSVERSERQGDEPSLRKVFSL
jgi:hypothetical protein